MAGSFPLQVHSHRVNVKQQALLRMSHPLLLALRSFRADRTADTRGWEVGVKGWHEILAFNIHSRCLSFRGEE